MPAAFMNAAATRCWPVPTPAVATEIEPGLAFAAATMSCNLAMRQILAADHHVTELVDQRDRHEILAADRKPSFEYSAELNAMLESPPTTSV